MNKKNNICACALFAFTVQVLLTNMSQKFTHFVWKIADAQRRATDKPLWKHILDKHEGRLEISIFEHFSMSRTGVFVKPQRRKANEGVRISKLNPDTRMNSKDEFRQGTNITMRPVRGVGE